MSGEAQDLCSAAPVNRILRSSIVDGPGNRAVVFVQGCNFNCIYCHNPETIALCSACGLCVGLCPAGALSTQEGHILWRREACVFCDACIRACPNRSSPRVRLLRPDEAMREIEPSLPFIRGITVSGGECMRYPAFLRGLGALARDRGKSFFLDTNGSYDFSPDPELLSRCDGVMLDVKAAPAEAEWVTGRKDYDPIPAAEFLARKGKLYEMRTVVSPGLFDAAALVAEACRRIAPIDPTVRYKLIRCRSAGVRPQAAAVLASPGDDLMEELAALCAGYGLKTVVV